jgi:hypothetical protein
MRITLAVIAALLCERAYTQTALLSPRNYTVDLENRNPYVGALLIVAEPNNVLGLPAGILAISSGVLIHERVFLTSGHGVGPSTPTLPPGINAYVTFSPKALDRNKWILAGTQVVHPTMPPCPPPEGCDPTTTNAFEAGDPLISDLGLIFLTTPAQGVTPARLAPRRQLENTKAGGRRMKTAGYGHPFPDPGNTRPPASARDGFRKYRKSRLDRVLNDRWAAWEVPSAVCYGDSGSPTLYHPFPHPFPNAARNQETIVAIASDGGADCLSKDLRSRVDTAIVQRWIEATVRQQLGERAARSLEIE